MMPISFTCSFMSSGCRVACSLSPPALTYADVCWRMLTHADVCWRMLTYADVCCCMRPTCSADENHKHAHARKHTHTHAFIFVYLAAAEKQLWMCSGSECEEERMLTYADVCWRMLTYADVTALSMQSAVGVGEGILTYADVCWRMLTYAEIALEALQGVCSHMRAYACPEVRTCVSLQYSHACAQIALEALW